MGYKELDIRVSVKASKGDVHEIIRKKTGISEFTYKILLKSLDARNKSNIVWQYHIGIVSNQIKTGGQPQQKLLEIPKVKNRKHVVIVGSGPSGIFSALVLGTSGFKVTLIERGSHVIERKKAIGYFEGTGVFNEQNNYAFGEGGAGTFSDGKLTSRTKSISLEKKYIFSMLIDAGAPQEIDYMAHPHLGSDNLVKITENLRKKFQSFGGKILFNTCLKDIKVRNENIVKIETDQGDIDADYFIFGMGNSALETTKMLINRGVGFQTKNFAIGMRAEHPQELINLSQWGVTSLPGIKAAEYRLAAKDTNGFPVYSFCMCPGGTVVPATAHKNTNIVNGMSLYQRNNTWANAAVVTGINTEEILKEKNSPFASIEWLESLEQKFYNIVKGYDAPSVLIKDFIQNKNSLALPKSSYPFGLVPIEISPLLPQRVVTSLQEGLIRFSRMIKGYDQGVLIGLESKTSSPVQVKRHDKKLYSTYQNLYVIGEGSGRAGGIVSSAADGIKAALTIIDKNI